jgi:hypothetical protein
MLLGLPSGLLCGVAFLLAQAQAVPAPPPTAAPEDPPAPPAYFIALAIGGSHRLAPAGEQLPPAYGMSVATLLGREYGQLGGLALGAAVHFDYQRYAHSVTIPMVRSGQQADFEDVRTLSYYDFAALQTATLPVGPVRLLAGAGVGLAMGYFSTLEPALRPGEARMVRPIVRASLGADATVGPEEGRLGLGLGMTLVFWEPRFSTAQGQTLAVFGDRLSANVSYTYAF